MSEWQEVNCYHCGRRGKGDWQHRDLCSQCGEHERYVEKIERQAEIKEDARDE